MQAFERLLKYVQYDTASHEESTTVPSTSGQKVLGAALVQEMQELGVRGAHMDEKGYVYGYIPENTPGQPAIGLIAHMDTVDCVPCQPMKARVISFDGNDVLLNEDGEMLSVERFPFLRKYAGQHLIVTDGRTVLGADDKSGIAEIMTACERLLSDDTIRHGRVCIAFTPDEEIGRGADYFDVEGFGADFAYTVDGGELGELEYENFNAANAKVHINGVSIHPGSAKNMMKNAVRIAAEFISLLPESESPEHTEGYEGFFHVDGIAGNVEHVDMAMIVRDHDRVKFERRKAMVDSVCAFLNGKYGAGTVVLDMKDSYYNMAEKLADKLFIIERAKKAMLDASVAPQVGAIRGGTDGAMLSWKGLPCPNLSTGGMNFHGRHECISVEAMQAMVQVLVNLVSVSD